jgi:hypothetical protein
LTALSITGQGVVRALGAGRNTAGSSECVLSAVLLALLVSRAAFGRTYAISTFAGGGLPVNITVLIAPGHAIMGWKKNLPKVGLLHRR